MLKQSEACRPPTKRDIRRGDPWVALLRRRRAETGRGMPRPYEERYSRTSASWPAARMSASDMRGTAPRSADGRRIKDAARVPQLIETARDAELRVDADIAIIDFAIVADIANDARSPIPGKPELLAVAAYGADEPSDLRLLRSERVVDVLRTDPELFGIHHRVQAPFHDQEPVVVLVPHHGRERLLGDDVGQDHMLAGVRKFQPHGVEAGDIGGEHFAFPGIIGLEHRVLIGELLFLKFDVVGAEI